MKKVRVGVIGLGMGRHHVGGYRFHPNAKVVAVADVNETCLEEVGKDLLGVKKRYTDPLEMLKKEQLDVVSIATPNMLHKPLTLAAFKAGCHVLCEKPMALSADEGREMIAAAESAGKRLMINFSYRFTPESQALKKKVQTGVLGDVYFARTIWHRRRGIPGFGGHFCQKAMSGGGPLIDLGVHRIDLALWLMDYPKPTWVMGSAYDPIVGPMAKAAAAAYDVEDLAAGFVKFANGATLAIEASWAANIAEQELMETRLFGTKGGLVQRNRNESYEFEAEIYTEEDGVLFDTRLHQPAPPSHCSMYHFIDAIVNDVPHTATGEEGLVVQELLDAIYLSAKTGKPVNINA
jgi:predicted dehydrogenase